MGTKSAHDDKMWVYELEIPEGAWRSTPGNKGEAVVEVAFLERGAVAMRNSWDLDTVLRYTPEEWKAFVLGVKDGEFDLGSD